MVVDPTGEQLTIWSATQIPHILRFALAATTGISESKIRVIAPDVGGGFGGKLQTTPEEWIAVALARRVGKPVKYTETRSESLMVAHHGRDQWQKLTLSAEKDGTVTGFKVELLADLGAYVAHRRRWRAGARGVHVQLDLQVPGLPVQLPDGADQQDLDRRLPRRRAARRRRTPSSGSWTSSPSRSASTRSRSGRRTGSSTRSSRSPRWPGWSTTPATTRRPPRGPRRCSGTTTCGPSRSGAASPVTGSSSASAISTFTEMCGLAPSRVLGSLELRRRRLGARERADAGHRQGRGRHRRRARTARATRRRSARSWPTGSGCRSRTSRCCTATPRSPTRASTPTARGRWSSAARHWSRRPTR